MKSLFLYLLFIVIIPQLSSQSCLPSGIVFNSQADINNFPIANPTCNTILGDVTIQGGDIVDLTPLAQLTAINGTLLIQFNPILPGLGGLNNITTVGGHLLLYNNDNPSFINMSGLSSLTSVGMHLNFDNLDRIQSLNGLENLTSIGGQLYIHNNFYLLDIYALNHPITIAGNLVISFNNSLSDCAAQAICGYLGNFMPPNTVTIASNSGSGGCSNQTEVEAACLLLPIELVDFRANSLNAEVLVAWRTASELNNNGFYIERKIAVKEDWQEIGFMPGSGTTNSPQHYEFNDRNPAEGVNYYRLRQMDLDGTAAYSKVVSMEMGSVPNVSIFPNPTSGYFQVTSEGDEAAEVFLQNGSGGSVALTALGEGGFDISSLHQGVYVLTVKKAKNVWVTKLLKQ